MFKQRSHKKELLDGNGIPEADLFLNLKELDAINHLLGGYNITFSALNKLVNVGKPCTLVDIGCGGGDTLKRIDAWRLKKGFDMNLVGVDIKEVCIAYAQQNNAGSSIGFIQDDYRNSFRHLPKIDILHACLFCHHLNEEQLIELIRFTIDHRTVLVVNDLERNPIAYYAIKWLTRLFSKSYLVKNDAPLSVLRGFKKREWLDMLQKAGAKHYTVKNKWAFRHQVIVYGN